MENEEKIKRLRRRVRELRVENAALNEYLTRVFERLKVVSEVWTSIGEIGKEMQGRFERARNQVRPIRKKPEKKESKVQYV